MTRELICFCLTFLFCHKPQSKFLARNRTIVARASASEALPTYLLLTYCLVGVALSSVINNPKKRPAANPKVFSGVLDTLLWSLTCYQFSVRASARAAPSGDPYLAPPPRALIRMCPDRPSVISS